MKTYKQYDVRWGHKGYPRKPYTVGSSGCGPCACAMCIQTLPKHKHLTPRSTIKYMKRHNYAIYGQGTAWAGITACLQNYGFIVKTVDMPEFLEEVAKPGVRGVLLFVGGTRGGITWTTSGHFIAVNDVKVKGGKHYVYTHDSGLRNHTGWYCYETQMRGLITQAWVAAPKKRTVNKKVSTSKTYKVTAKDGLNIRQGASTKYKIKGALAYGKKVKITKQKNNFGYAPAYKGWVSMKYLKK